MSMLGTIGRGVRSLRQAAKSSKSKSSGLSGGSLTGMGANLLKGKLKGGQVKMLIIAAVGLVLFFIVLLGFLVLMVLGPPLMIAYKLQATGLWPSSLSGGFLSTVTEKTYMEDGILYVPTVVGTFGFDYECAAENEGDAQFACFNFDFLSVESQLINPLMGLVTTQSGSGPIGAISSHVRGPGKYLFLVGEWEFAVIRKVGTDGLDSIGPLALGIYDTVKNFASQSMPAEAFKHTKESLEQFFGGSPGGSLEAFLGLSEKQRGLFDKKAPIISQGAAPSTAIPESPPPELAPDPNTGDFIQIDLSYNASCIQDNPPDEYYSPTEDNTVTQRCPWLGPPPPPGPIGVGCASNGCFTICVEADCSGNALLRYTWDGNPDCGCSFGDIQTNIAGQYRYPCPFAVDSQFSNMFCPKDQGVAPLTGEVDVVGSFLFARQVDYGGGDLCRVAATSPFSAAAHLSCGP